jgi:predicted acylesterase/phospholipase RssA
MEGVMKKTTKRGFVMTGGGAKGLYEAGVIHAFHLCGMEFDVITGSSIGAINSVFYAEYQYRKKQQLSVEAVAADPLQAVEAMDPLVRAFLHAWWQMPSFQIIDDSETGPLGQLKDDLQQFDLTLPQLTRLAWWYTDPQRRVTNSIPVWPDMVRLVREFIERLGSGQAFYRLWQESREKGYSLLDVSLRAYLDRFDIEYALVPDQAADNLRQVFTRPTAPLQAAHLAGAKTEDGGPRMSVVEGTRTMRDYADAGLDVRLTRANYRTGRLEVSTYYSAQQFVDFMRRHAWRWPGDGARAVSLGSERLQVIGNPGAVNAALASGRFPGVFSPMPIKKIYEFEEREDADNALLQRLLAHWLDDEELRQALFAAYTGSSDLTKTYESWRQSDGLRRLFPQEADYYVDGGAIDNTPANNAIDGIKEWAKQNDVDMRALALDLYTVFLHPAPDPGHEQPGSFPALYEVVQRTLAVQGAAKLASDAVSLRTINHFGQRGEHLDEVAGALADGLQELTSELAADMQGVLTEEQQAALDAALSKRLEGHIKRAAGRRTTGHDMHENLAHIQRDLQRHLKSRLPLHVQPVEIYPDEMPMSTLQFTERLGYKRENAIRMMTVGCYNTLWTLRAHLENKPAGQRDAMDERALDLARHWMGFEDWPDDLQTRQETWQCQRESCVFYEGYCPRGK